MSYIHQRPHRLRAVRRGELGQPAAHIDVDRHRDVVNVTVRRLARSVHLQSQIINKNKNRRPKSGAASDCEHRSASDKHGVEGGWVVGG